jgi:hypothetical protein
LVVAVPLVLPKAAKEQVEVIVLFLELASQPLPQRVAAVVVPTTTTPALMVVPVVVGVPQAAVEHF